MSVYIDLLTDSGINAMSAHRIKGNELSVYEKFLREEEKSALTIDKYTRDSRLFLSWMGKRRTVGKAVALEYKAYLVEHYAASSVNRLQISK